MVDWHSLGAWALTFVEKILPSFAVLFAVIVTQRYERSRWIANELVNKRINVVFEFIHKFNTLHRQVIKIIHYQYSDQHPEGGAHLLYDAVQVSVDDCESGLEIVTHYLEDKDASVFRDYVSLARNLKSEVKSGTGSFLLLKTEIDNIFEQTIYPSSIKKQFKRL